MNAGLIYLVIAIVLEVAGTTSMKLSEGFHHTAPSILIFVFYGFSFAAMTLALKWIDVSVAYAIWSGLGTVLIVAIGALYFREPLTMLRIVCVGLIIVGVAGLHLSGTGQL